MVKHFRWVVFALATISLVAQTSAKPSAKATQQKAKNAARRFHVEKLAEGVYAAVRDEPPGFAVESNSLFIIGERNVVVVDAQSNLGSTRQVLAALRRLTSKPVRYVINTHWHDDHIIGNQVYRDAFPGVEFITHAETRAYLASKGAEVRKDFHKQIPEFASQIRKAVNENKNLRGEPISGEERTSYLSDLALADGYMTVPGDFQPEFATITLRDELTLYQGNRVIEIRYLGRGHTSGDIVVHLPNEGIVATGDLIVWPVPLVGGDQSHVGDWGATLEKLRALKGKVLVPGHGPVMHDDSYLQLLTRLLNSVKQQTEVAAMKGATLDEARKQVDLTDLRNAFVGNSKVRRVLFSAYVTGPAVESAFKDAKAKP
jgi:cyclase